MDNKIQTIEVWPDLSKGPNPSWTVSLCWNTDNSHKGEQIQLLSSREKIEEALEKGREEARKLGLSLLINPTDSQKKPSVYATADQMKIEQILISLGEKFSSSSPIGKAQEWIERGFGPNEVNQWTNQGVWSSSVAQDFKNNGLSPGDLTSISKSLSDRYQDPIHAVCNGDLDVKMFVATKNGGLDEKEGDGQNQTPPKPNPAQKEVTLKDIVWGGRMRSAYCSEIWSIARKAACRRETSISGNMISSCETVSLYFLGGSVWRVSGYFGPSSGTFWDGDLVKSYILYKLGLDPKKLLKFKEVPDLETLEEIVRKAKEEVKAKK